MIFISFRALRKMTLVKEPLSYPLDPVVGYEQQDDKSIMVRIDQSGVFIVDEAEHQVGGSAWRSGREAGFRIDCRTGMSFGNRVGDATHFGAACDDVHYSFRCRFCRLLVATRLTLGECVLSFV